MATYTKVHREDADHHGASWSFTSTEQAGCQHDQVVVVNSSDNLHNGLDDCEGAGLTATIPTADASDSDRTTLVLSSSQPRITWFDACMHLIKGNLGPGCLNLPHAFAESGWLLGTILFLVVALQGIYSMILLAECKDLLLTSNRPVLTFMDVAQVSLGPVGRAVVQVFLFVLQSGVCCVFLSLISTNLRAQTSLSSPESIVLVTAALLLVSMFRHMKNLRCLSTTANIFMLTAILTAAVAAGYSISQNDIPLPAKSTSDVGIVATFISSMFFSFEGIGLVLPVENAFTISPHPDEVSQANRFFRQCLLPSAMSVVGILFWITGFLASWGFPGIHSGSITAYLAQEFPHQLWFQIVNTMVMMAVFLTFPLQLTPALEVLEDLLQPVGTVDDAISLVEMDVSNHSSSSTSSEVPTTTTMNYGRDNNGEDPLPLDSNIHQPVSSKTLWQRYDWIILRYAIVLGCSMVVLVVDDLGLLMALFGAVGQTGLAMMPCLCHMALQRHGMAPPHRFKTIMDIVTVIFSTAVMIFGVYISISKMIYR